MMDMKHVQTAWRTSTLLGACLVAQVLGGCGVEPSKAASHPQPKTDNSLDAEPVNFLSQCQEVPPNHVFVTNVIQDMYGRPPNKEELALAQSPDFNPETFVDGVLSSPQADDGYTRFIASLFRVSNIAPDDPQDPTSVALAEDLKQEPVILFLRNKDKKWSWFWETRDILCSQRTARLYDYPIFNTEGFVSCIMPPERSGFLGLVSVLRASSTPDNPQAFFKPNNNYHRVAAAVYFAQGFQLLAATNGPAGDGPLIPMADCVPATDTRVSGEGLIFGTAAVPTAGSTCSGCHSPYLAPLSIAFRRFGTRGELLKLTDIEALPAQERQGVSVEHLKAILAEPNSCWSNGPGKPPEQFLGLAGLGSLIAKAPTLGQALGTQVPQMMANITPDEGMVKSIEQSYLTNGETLQSAFRGFFLSESYGCR